MAALTASRNTPEWNGAFRYHYGLLPVEASTSIYVGGMVARNAAGNVVPAQVTATGERKLQVMGICEYVYAGGMLPPGINALNQTGNIALFPGATAVLGTAGAISVGVACSIFGMDADASITAANVGEMCFALDDHTVTLGTLVPNTTAIVTPAVETLGILGGVANVLAGTGIVPGSVDVWSATGATGTHYLEGTDYRVLYDAGILITMTAGGITPGATVYVTYYNAALHSPAGQIVGIEGGLVYVNFSGNIYF